MIYGIMVEKDVKLSSVVRALKEKTTPQKVEDILAIPSETTPRSRCQIFTLNVLGGVGKWEKVDLG